MKRYLIGLALLAAAVPATAKTTVSLYDGPDAVRTGTGGSKTVSHDVEYWVTGTPPRRFRLIGFAVTQKDLDAGSVAKTVKEAGGNAAIVLDQSTQDDGVRTFVLKGINDEPIAITRRDTTTTSKLAIIRYLD